MLKLANNKLYCLLRKYRIFSTLADSNFHNNHVTRWYDLDFSYLCSEENLLEIKNNIYNRKAVGNIEKVSELYKSFLECECKEHRLSLESYLVDEALKIPNKSHPSIKSLNDKPKVVRIIQNSPDWSFQPLPFEQLVKNLNLIRTENLTNMTGPRSYYLIDGLAELEEALIQYTLKQLIKHNFCLISVPDLLPRNIIEYCGMETRGERTQVYSLDSACGENVCLSGTAEMGIAYFLQGKKFDKSKLPLKLASVSRCFRAETSKISVEKGIYRVHQFTKVEMFGVTDDKKSDDILEEFCHIQETLFSALNLHLRILDMPECELGAQAYRKFDIECLLPGKKYWGELSSTSNCTDYQSRRLNIKCTDGNYLHTVNGTACAVPRLLIAILETNQKEDGSIKIPEILIPFLGYDTIRKSKIPKIIPFKMK